jgi:hypothetical protein
MTVRLLCIQCGQHLWTRAEAFAPGELASPVGTTHPNGRPATHGERLLWCGCPEPAKGQPVLQTED